MASTVCSLPTMSLPVAGSGYVAARDWLQIINSPNNRGVKIFFVLMRLKVLPLLFLLKRTSA
jgi:hypothetical protein